MPSKFPDRMRLGMAMHFTIGHGLEDYDGTRGEGERLLRFVLPPFQRGEVWTPAQKSRFIESIWLGLPISVYAYNQSRAFKHRTDQWLIDGQQRWSAIRDFMADKVKVFGGLKHSDMSEAEDRKFQNTVFPCILIQSDDEDELREMYERLAYGGTPHAK